MSHRLSGLLLFIEKWQDYCKLLGGRDSQLSSTKFSILSTEPHIQNVLKKKKTQKNNETKPSNSPKIQYNGMSRC